MSEDFYAFSPQKLEDVLWAYEKIFKSMDSHSGKTFPRDSLDKAVGILSPFGGIPKVKELLENYKNASSQKCLQLGEEDYYF